MRAAVMARAKKAHRLECAAVITREAVPTLRLSTTCAHPSSMRGMYLKTSSREHQSACIHLCGPVVAPAASDAAQNRALSPLNSDALPPQ
jgi:hypothetical protein